MHTVFFFPHLCPLVLVWLAALTRALSREQRWASHWVAQRNFTVKHHLDWRLLHSPARPRSTMHGAKSLMCSHVLFSWLHDENSLSKQLGTFLLMIEGNINPSSRTKIINILLWFDWLSGGQRVAGGSLFSQPNGSPQFFFLPFITEAFLSLWTVCGQRIS